jgi:NADH dehydrogenase [ubiquinone] 1 alpha subcomplex assembly factor 1
MDHSGRQGVLPLLLLALTTMFTTALAGAEQARLFDFPAAAEWQAVNDGVMGGVSEGRVRITAGRTLEFFGTLSLENNGGFASVRSVPRPLGLTPGDVLVARVRGDGREYQLNLYVPGRARAFSYRWSFVTVKDQWIEVRMPLDRFVATSFGQPVRGAGTVEPALVTSVGFLLSDKVPGPFKLEVAWIDVVRQPPPPAPSPSHDD